MRKLTCQRKKSGKTRKPMDELHDLSSIINFIYYLSIYYLSFNFFRVIYFGITNDKLSKCLVLTTKESSKISKNFFFLQIFKNIFNIYIIINNIINNN